MEPSLYFYAVLDGVGKTNGADRAGTEKDLQLSTVVICDIQGMLISSIEGMDSTMQKVLISVSYTHLTLPTTPYV